MQGQARPVHCTWRGRGAQPLFTEADGKPSSKTVIMAAMEAMHEKLEYNYKDAAVDAQCRRIASTLQQPNLFPPSLYALKQVIGVEPLQNFEEHACVNGCLAFDSVPPAEWIDRKDER